jgi:hypothetical protein
MTNDEWLKQLDNDIDRLARVMKEKARGMNKADVINKIVELRRVVHEALNDPETNTWPI